MPLLRYQPNDKDHRVVDRVALNNDMRLAGARLCVYRSTNFPGHEDERIEECAWPGLNIPKELY